MSSWAATGSHQAVDMPMPRGQGFVQNAFVHGGAANARSVGAPVAEMVYEANASTLQEHASAIAGSPLVWEDVAEYLYDVEVVPSLGPGSIGHPQLCDRPCLYFAKNECANGMDCEYC
eukprot:CAMPEP_0203912232 /NCGR_PEP_ID=MMETSP0359-20131031/53322_1 /ASSEMBLY_ACC=CAM_ASM_000338 /TAXON_ID=268821 /ORGANISM="Scrippsiella Hangoei, Strain SHTV-5" /LENGTH=117 /DNA_ID=CAMNT_0050838123 /DNA_START=18 /DNA_END=368 /DNA_ORIENTATION=+